ncbi:46493_t:CDS:2 [Gigaspora margarita]|uniref:46493_t:CDS:1 n=1 Tax=Gigaspora margarita TaxID=4874 RepID=A0ABM8W6U7_GIGMA|nr:46493_t:CDS:2 [Gigaspora margarita]
MGVKTIGKYSFPIKNKEIAKRYITEVKKQYIIPRVMPIDHIDVNYTDKLLLPRDPKKIKGVNIKIPITNPKELIEAAMIKESQPEKEIELPITKYENIEQTIEILKTKFEFSNIPQLLVQLPKLDIPE